MKNSRIAWTDHTFNPWIGCAKMSEGCRNCYAEREQKRWGRDLWGFDKPRMRTSEGYWRNPISWDREADRECVRRRVFCGSLCDWLDKAAPEEWRDDLFRLIDQTPNLDWMMLTKRAERLEEPKIRALFSLYPNAWCGITAENQEELDRRIEHLTKVPAAIRFISVEPMLGEIQLPQVGAMNRDWLVICGGESGPEARPFNLEWVYSLKDQCRAQRIAFFMKQLGKRPFNGYTRDSGFQVPNWMQVTDPKGGDMAEWPPNLRVQEML